MMRATLHPIRTRQSMRARLMRIGAAVGIGVMGLLVAAAPVAADSILAAAIIEPAEGASISRGATPTLRVAGAARFDVAQPSETTFYVGRFGCDGDPLTITRPSASTGCIDLDNLPPSLAGIAPLNEVSDGAFSHSYTTVAGEGVPFTLDATRPLAGVVTTGSVARKGDNSAGVGAGLMTVEIRATATEAGVTEARTLGTTSVSYLATPQQGTWSEPWSIELPADMDKTDISRLTLTLVVRGVNALHGSPQTRDTYVTVPTYTASFDRRVEIALDGGPFSTEGPVAEDGTTWTTEMETPTIGPHVIRARAVQGWLWATTASGPTLVPRTSPIDTRSFNVIE